MLSARRQGTASVRPYSPVIQRFGLDVNRGRRLLFREFRNLPPPLNRVAAEQYMARASCSRSMPMMSEYAPWILSDFLGCLDHQFLSRLAVPWLLINAYTLFIDDLIDRDDVKSSGDLLLVSGLILQRGLTTLYSVIPSTPALRKSVDHYFARLAAAVAAELSGRVHPKPRQMSAHKIYTLGLCAVCVTAVGGVPIISETDLLRIDTLAMGMQQLDDVVDWEEDWRSGNLTPHLQSCFDCLVHAGIRRAERPSRLSSDEVSTSLVLTGATERSLGSVLTCFESICEGSRPSLLEDYLRSSIASIRGTIRLAKDIRVREVRSPELLSRRHVRNVLDNEAAQRKIKLLNRQLVFQGN